MKNRFILLLVVVVLIQLWVPASMILKHERVLREGELFRFKTLPIDPADPFQGRYVWLRYANAYIPGSDENEARPDRRQKVYVSLRTEDDGFAVLNSWSIEQPDDGSSLALRFSGARNRYDRSGKVSKRIYEGLRFNLPFTRFYMDENKAPVAEKIAREGMRNTNCWANVRVLDGVGLIEDVMVEGVSIGELAQQRLDQE